MRLIDADELVKQVKTWHCFEDNYPYQGETDIGWRDVVTLLDILEAPTVGRD